MTSDNTPGPIRKYEPLKEDVIRIDVVELPEKREKDEGLFRWRHMTDDFYVDIMDLIKELKKVSPEHHERLLDRVHNFRKLYINLATGETST